MALQGTLESFGVSEIFQLVSQQGKTGTLEIEAEDGVARIRFLGGKIVEAWANPRPPSELIGAMLVRGGFILAAQLDHALELQRQNLRPLGAILVRLGAVRLSDFKNMLQLQHRETVYKLLARRRGRFSFRDEPVALEEGVSVLLDTGSLLMEGFRQIDEWPRLRAAFPDENRVLVPVRQPERKLLPDEALVLSLVDGVNTLREVADRARLGEFAAWKALAALAGDGVVAPLSAERTRWTPTRPKAASAIRISDLVVAALLALLSVGVVVGGDLGGLVSRLWEAPQTARREASGVTRLYEAWAQRKLPSKASESGRR